MLIRNNERGSFLYVLHIHDNETVDAITCIIGYIVSVNVIQREIHPNI